MAMSNAVNLTDGLDGLATGASVMVIGVVRADRVLAVPALGATTAYYNGDYSYEVRDPLEIAIIAGAAAGAPASASCGGTPHRPASSWATPARWRSAG